MSRERKEDSPEGHHGHVAAYSNYADADDNDDDANDDDDVDDNNVDDGKVVNVSFNY